MKRETDSEQLVLMLRSARELLGAGVTTARDLGARSFLDVAVRDAIDRGDAIGPRILASGAPITPTGGHCWFMGGEADGEVELRRAVRLRHRAGVDWIKVMSTGGFMTAGSAPWFAQFSEDELAAIVSDAHRLGKRVAAHAHGVQGIERAVAAGVDNLEHCSFVDENANLAYSPSLGADIARRGIPVSFTLNARSIGTPGRKNGAAWTAAMRDMLDQGLALIVGTDAGIDSVPHSAYVTGLEALLACGVPAREVFEAATSRCADALGVGGETGRLREGFSADFLVVDADPLTDLSVLRAHSLVVARGRAFVSAGLSE